VIDIKINLSEIWCHISLMTWQIVKCNMVVETPNSTQKVVREKR
jgi:hypothetical protein